jgi:hypothetical protein
VVNVAGIGTAKACLPISAARLGDSTASVVPNVPKMAVEQAEQVVA